MIELKIPNLGNDGTTINEFSNMLMISNRLIVKPQL